MYRLVSLFCIILISCSGCTAHHYLDKNRDSVSFHLKMDDAIRVQFASSMDAYELHETRKNNRGFWQIDFQLTPESTYFYIVDGSVHVPDCRFKETDDFGSENCLYVP